MQKKFFTTVIVGLLAAVLPGSGIWAFAGSVVIENEVSVSATSGGNTVGEGKEIVGKASGDIVIETVVNDEVVEHVEEHVTSEAGEPVEIQKETLYESKTQNIQVEANIQAQVTESEQQQTRKNQLRSETSISLISIGVEENSFSIHSFLRKLFDYVFGFFNL